nr:L1_beta_lactamase [uncultured bacterium]AIA18079.1 L1_beta_lactamase [uncultured bacterium]
MKRLAALTAALCLSFSASANDPNHIDCGSCAAWNVAQKPFKIVGNTYYVGTKELSAMLVTTPKGHVLLDGALPQSAAQIEANIKALGFNIRDVKYILNSHAHWDHAGGISALQKASGATVLASEWGARVLRAGTVEADDPQYNPKHIEHFPKVANVRAVKDNEVIRVGDVAITALMAPGHTPGSTTWTWKSCEAGKCHDIVYADSLTAVSADDFRFTGGAGKPDLSDSFRSTIDRIGKLQCDVIVSTHPGFTDTLDKLAKTTPTHNGFLVGGCAEYAAASLKRFDERIATERR